MNLNKLLIAALSTLCFTACDNDDDNVVVDIPVVYKGMFVLNQGNMGKNIPGSITNINLKKGESVQNVFMAANDRTVGDSPQTGIIYGGKMYVGVHGSGTLEIMDKNTLRSVKMLALTGVYAGPRSLAAKDGKVYMSLYDGYVARLDTLSMEVDKKIKVGPNPDGIAILGNYLYVTNSDGMNYLNGYANGYSVSKIDLSTFTEECKIPVAMNPTKIATDGQDVFVISMGNYTAEYPSILQRLNINYDSEDENSIGAENLCEASMMAVCGDIIYCIKAPIWGVSTDYEYFTYKISDGTKTAFTPQGMIDPQAMAFDSKSGHLFISTLSAAYAYDDPFKIVEYTSACEFVDSYEAGVGAYAFVF